MSSLERPASKRWDGGLLVRLKQALFEDTAGTPEPQARSQSDTSTVPASTLSAERSASAVVDEDIVKTLEAAAAEQHGPALAELRLQVDALAEAIPDEELRLRAALRVLEKKALSDALAAELEGGLRSLDLKRDTWSGKVAARRSEHERERAEIEAEFERARAEACAELERLNRLIDVARQSIASAESKRAERLAAAQRAQTELDARDRAFHAAYGDVQARHAALRDQIARAFTHNT
jgi:hypothetical protein